jgi:hypothetical protein
MALQQVMSHGLFANINLIICSQGTKWSHSKRKAHDKSRKIYVNDFFTSQCLIALDPQLND